MSKRRKFTQRTRPSGLAASRQSKRAPVDPNDVRFIALHEAGHAVAAVMTGAELLGVDIKTRRLPDGRISRGFTNSPVQAVRSPEEALPALVRTLAGPIAESVLNPQALAGGGDGHDAESAKLIAAIAVCKGVEDPSGRLRIEQEEIAQKSGEIAALIVQGEEEALAFVRQNIAVIIEVANRLLEATELSADEVSAIIKANTPNAVASPSPIDQVESR